MEQLDRLKNQVFYIDTSVDMNAITADVNGNLETRFVNKQSV